MTDGELADAILRKIAADEEACLWVERGEAFARPGVRYSMGLIDSSWQTLSEEEADYLERVRADGDRAQLEQMRLRNPSWEQT